jgi:hypothetical protein
VLGTLPAGHHPLAVRPREQQQFEATLTRKRQKMSALWRAITPWILDASAREIIIDVTIYYCGRYYLDCLPDTVEGSRARLARRIKRAAGLTERLATELRAIHAAREPTVQTWLGPLLTLYLPNLDGLRLATVDPGFVLGLDELWRVLALLDQALPYDRGGTRRAVAFRRLVRALHGICSQFGGKNFAAYMGAVVDLIRATAPAFPRARFDLPPTDEALRKAQTRALSPRATLRG